MEDPNAVKTPPTATPNATQMTAPTVDPSATPAGTPDATGKPSSDGKPAEAKPGEGTKKEGAPEKYDFKLPEGYKVESEERFGKFTALAKELNLSQEQAQKLVDLALENSAAAGKEFEKAQEIEQKAWAQEIATDPELGGANATATIQLARRALKEFATPKFMQMLEDPKYGRLGNNPDLVRVFVAIGKKMSDDKFVDGKPSGTQESKSAAEILYGKQ